VKKRDPRLSDVHFLLFLDQELAVVVLVLVLVGDRLQKKPKAPSFQMGLGRVVLLANTHRLTESDFKMAAMTSFQAEKCCHLMNDRMQNVRHLCSSVRQFLIYSAFVLVCLDFRDTHKNIRYR